MFDRPEGFTCATTSLTFSPRELPDTQASMDLGAIVLDEPTDLLAGVFTRNKLCGAPVTLGRALVALRQPRVQCVLTNNKVSNVRPGPGLGEACAREVAACGDIKPHHRPDARRLCQFDGDTSVEGRPSAFVSFSFKQDRLRHGRVK